jgi:hypothetical protein
MDIKQAPQALPGLDAYHIKHVIEPKRDMNRSELSLLDLKGQ